MVLEIVTEAPDLDDVERMLRLADEVVRHKLIRLPDGEAATPRPARRGHPGPGRVAEKETSHGNRKHRHARGQRHP